MYKIFGLLFLLLNFTFAAGQKGSDRILGDWLATDRSVSVRVYKVGDNFRAKVLWFDESLGSGRPMHARRDTENPNPALRNRKIIGMEILKGLEYNEKTGTWEHGKIYDASTGRHWDSAVRMDSSGILYVRGYWRFKWIGKSMTFKKIK